MRPWEFKKKVTRALHKHKGSQPVGSLISCTPVDAIPATPVMYVSQTLQDWSMGEGGLTSWKERDLNSGSKWPVSDPPLDPGPARILLNLQTQGYLTQLLSTLFWKNGSGLQVALCARGY